MSRNELINMARESGLSNGDIQLPANVEYFANLVAAAEREKMKWDGIHTCSHLCERPACVARREAVESEREACAQIVEREAAQYSDPVWAVEIVNDIRARG